MQTSTSTTASIVYATLGFGVLVLVAFGLACYFEAPAEAFTTLSWIAAAFGFGGGIGGAGAHGLRHWGSKAPTSSQLAAPPTGPPGTGEAP